LGANSSDIVEAAPSKPGASINLKQESVIDPEDPDPESEIAPDYGPDESSCALAGMILHLTHG